MPDTTKHTLLLREEQLDITKNRVELGKVNIHKEVITEERTITVPVTREELVIESGSSDAVIRIPLNEERLEIAKHRVDLEDVKVYMNTTQEIQHIEELLRKEQLHIQTIGTPVVVQQDAES